MACQSAPLVGAGTSATTITPNGDGRQDRLDLTYELGQAGTVSITLTGPDGRRYVLRENEPRSRGQYVLRFDGTVIPDGAPDDRRVLGDGTYRWDVTVTPADGGTPQSATGEIIVSGADTQAPVVADVVAEPRIISPNADGRDDDTIVAWSLSKDAVVEIYARDASGNRFVLEAPTERVAALHNHRWNGTFNGRLLPDGIYQVHVTARDTAGNVTDRSTTVEIANGGTAGLVITAVRMTPRSLPRGSFLDVEIDVRNNGDVPLQTLGPPPGTVYTTLTNFNSFRDVDDPNAPPQFFERAGVWRVGVDWENSGRPYPVRWGLTENLRPLMPGEEATVRGSIQILIDQTPTVVFWASVVQEGVGFPGGRVGLTRITISF